MNSANTSITCHTCNNSVPRQKAFYIYDYSFCSTKCTESIRKLQKEELQRKSEQDAKRPKQGAFTLSSGGSY